MQTRKAVLLKIADAIEAKEQEILEENAADVKKAQESKIDENLMQRLGLKPQKMKNLIAGIRSIAEQDEPIRKVSQLSVDPACSPTGELRSKIQGVQAHDSVEGSETVSPDSMCI